MIVWLCYDVPAGKWATRFDPKISAPRNILDCAGGCVIDCRRREPWGFWFGWPATLQSCDALCIQLMKTRAKRRREERRRRKHAGTGWEVSWKRKQVRSSLPKQQQKHFKLQLLLLLQCWTLRWCWAEIRCECVQGRRKLEPPGGLNTSTDTLNIYNLWQVAGLLSCSRPPEWFTGWHPSTWM